MMSSGMLSSGMLGAIVYLGLGSLAVAQLPKSAAPAPAAKSESPPPVDAEPNSTSANFGDWTLRCQRLGNGAETRRVCEVTQQIRAQDQQNPVAELAIGRLKKADPLRLTVVLPVNVTISNPPSFSADSKVPELLDLAWRKCLPGGCIADALMTDEMRLDSLCTIFQQHSLSLRKCCQHHVSASPEFRGARGAELLVITDT